MGRSWHLLVVGRQLQLGTAAASPGGGPLPGGGPGGWPRLDYRQAKGGCAGSSASPAGHASMSEPTPTPLPPSLLSMLLALAREPREAAAAGICASSCWALRGCCSTRSLHWKQRWMEANQSVVCRQGKAGWVAAS